MKIEREHIPLLIAFANDVVQVFIQYFEFIPGTNIPSSVLDILLDLVTLLVLSHYLRDWKLILVFLAELIDVVDILPLWTFGTWIIKNFKKLFKRE